MGLHNIRGNTTMTDAERVAAYLRVSSQEQTVDNQLPVLQAFAERRGWEIAEVYSESETAWKSGHQHELARLLSDCRNGRRRYDAVVVWALDRLSREGAAAVLNLVNTFKAYGVKVVSYQEPWTEAPGEIGEILYAIAGWVAKMESGRRSERTKAGLARAIRQGRKLGRPKGSRDTRRRSRSGYLLRYVRPELRDKYSK
jgi:DNA invertase Pin-like site-specific DNA recombinase